MTDLLQTPYGMTIAGQRVEGAERFEVVNPATEASFALAPDCTREELDHAVAAAREAFPSWAATTIEERQATLLDMAKIIKIHADRIAALLVQEQGKPRQFAYGEVVGAIHWCGAFSKQRLDP